MDDFKQLIESLGRELGLDLSQGIESPFEVAIDDLAITVSSDRRRDEEEVVLYAKLGVVAKEQELDVYRVMLDANVLWAQTDDCTLGVNMDTREAIICHRVPSTRLDGPILAKVLSAFADNAKNWVNFIEATNNPGAAGRDPLAGDLANFIRI